MKKIFIFLFLILTTGSVHAVIPSIMGGRAMTEDVAHHVAVGWPGLSYEWWHSGSPDWGIGGEFLYGDWSGEFSDVSYGIALNTPLLWHMGTFGSLDVGFRLAPGVMWASMGKGVINNHVYGFRGDVGFPMTITLGERVNLLTGFSVPFTYLFIQNTDNILIVPGLVRLGFEASAEDRLTPFILAEVGPAYGKTNSGSDMKLGVRLTAGCTIW